VALASFVSDKNETTNPIYSKIFFIKSLKKIQWSKIHILLIKQDEKRSENVV
jgi:hypothetical protein